MSTKARSTRRPATPGRPRTPAAKAARKPVPKVRKPVPKVKTPRAAAAPPVSFAPDARPRCGWSYSGMSAEYIAYHDQEWGVPVHDDRRLFEFLILEGAQAGLSWSTILRKREGYRESFADFDPVQVAKFDSRKVEKLLQFPGIVRNRLKVAAAITNARCFLEVQEEFGSFAAIQLAVRRRPADRESMARDVTGAGDVAGVGCVQQGPAAAWLQVRGLHDHVCTHAGDGDGE